MTSGSRKILVVLLGMLATIGPLSIDMYLPALPAIQSDFSVSAADVQLTLSSFFIGFSLGQLLHGPLSDRYGRKPVLLSGIILYAVTSLLCAVVRSIEALIFIRFFHAIGGVTGIVLARAMVRDLFPADETARMISLITIITLLGPMISPVIGGYLLIWAGWRSIFWLLTVLGVIFLFMVAFAIKESHPEDRREQLNLVTTFKAYWEIVSNRRAFGYLACMSLGTGVMFAYVVSSPFLIIEFFGVRPDNFGYFHGIVVAGMIFCAILNSRVVVSRGIERMIVYALVIRVFGAVLLFILSFYNVGGLPGLIFAMVLCVGPNALLFANISAAVMDIFPRLSGTASALMGALMIACGAVMGSVVGIFHDGTVMPLACLTVVLSVASAVSYWYWVKLPVTGAIH